MGLLVLYQIEGEGQDSDGIPNALELPLSSKKEVYLIDILNYILSSEVLEAGIGVDYSFNAILDERSRKLVHLESPSSVVPFSSDGTIRLLLTRSYCPPIVHPEQSYDQNMLSREKIYSFEKLKAAEPVVHSQFAEHAKRMQYIERQEPKPRVSDQTANPQYSKDAAPLARDPVKPTKPTKNVSAKQESTKFTKRSDDIPQYESSERYNRSNFEEERSNPGVGDINFQSIVGDDAAQAIAGAAKNFLSWTTKSIQKVTEVIQEAQAGTGTNAIMKVGKTRVQMVKQIAEGGFGVVFLVQDTKVMDNATGEGQMYALKQLIIQDKDQSKEAQAELDALQRFQGHENIIRLLDYSMVTGVQSHKQVLMLFPMYDKGTVWDVLETEGSVLMPGYSSTAPVPHMPSWPFPEAKALYIILCTAHALQFMHSKGYAHRDVKPHNVLLSDSSEMNMHPTNHNAQFSKIEQRIGRKVGRPVVMDLGSVTKACVSITNRRDALNLEDEAASKTSAGYRAPELTSPPYPPCEIDERVDVWGLGCTAFCLAFGRSPFETTAEGISRLAILNGKYQVPPKATIRGTQFSDAYIQLIEGMLNVDHTKRLFMKDVISTCESLLENLI